MTPSDLLAKLEEAECGSPALDREIMILDGWRLDEVSNPTPMWIAPAGRKFPYGSARAVTAVSDCYPYTRMVDAALSLVPEGRSRQHRTAEHHENGFVVELWVAWGPDAYKRLTAQHRSEPIAICSAALRARAVMGGGK